MKKKFGLLVTIILSMLFLVACGGNGDKKEGADAGASTGKDTEAAAVQKTESKKNAGQSQTAQNASERGGSAGVQGTRTGVAQGQGAAEGQGRETSLRRLQLGLFREKANADRLVAALKDKGFTAAVTTETRASGTTYYIVAVDETDGSIGDKLRTAGFEFYPL